MQNLKDQIEDLQQTPDHRLSAFEVRVRRLMVQMYELLQDIQIQNRDLNNRIESMSRDILEDLPPIVSGKDKKK